MSNRLEEKRIEAILEAFDNSVNLGDGVSTVEIDARDPRNNRPCTAPRHVGGPPKSAAGALKLRRTYMAQCECRLCALAMFPARTFSEWEAFGLATIRAEHDASPFGQRGPRFQSLQERAGAVKVYRIIRKCAKEINP